MIDGYSFRGCLEEMPRCDASFTRDRVKWLEEFTPQPYNPIGLDLELLGWALEIP